jgi:hypothetical protein
MRTLVGLLVLANLLFYCWTQGWLDEVAPARARGDREPERVARQVHPEVVHLLTPQALAAAASAAEAPRICLEAGPFDAQSVPGAEAALAATLPPGSWARRSIDAGPPWAVYMGRFASPDAQSRKEQELTRLHVPFEPVSAAPRLEPGLVLGRFAQREAADAALAQLVLRGVQTARVVELPGAPTQHMLRIERADSELAARVAALRLEKAFVACPRS